jgi:PII-like signaling protein
MTAEVTIVRIYIHEGERGRRANLVDEIMEILHDRHRVKGATVFRGIAGFGASGEVHAADLLRLSADLPLVIEFFDVPEVAAAALALIEGIVPSGHIVSWNAQLRSVAGSNPSAD